MSHNWTTIGVETVSLKRVTFLVNGEKIRLDAEKREVTGPEHLMKIIREENEKLQGSRVTIQDPYMDLPPSPYLWQSRSLFPLLKYIFGNENVGWDEREPVEYWQPLDPNRAY
jgi:hypothetical protein